MPQLDMQLNELKTYMGTNPCPKDFDIFWDKGIAEMRALDPDIEIVKSDFKVPYALCYDLYFTGIGGGRIHVRYLKPKDIQEGKKIPAVLQFHGYSMNAGDWQNKLPLVALGYAVFAMDCRGQGGTSTDVGGVVGGTLFGHIVKGLDDIPEKMYYRQTFLDTAQLAAIVMDMDHIDENRVAAMGGSQGGGLTLACAALEPRIKKIAAMHPFLCDYERVWDMDFDVDAYIGLKDYFRRFDPNHQRHEEIFTKLGYIDVAHLTKRIKAEVIMATGLIDSICPPSTQFAAYNKIKSKKNMLIYHDYGHEWYPEWDDKVFEYLLDL